jgi:uncharacterized protein YdhG (YjbR/CyaY superfamily)
MTALKSVDAYIAAAPAEVRPILQAVRSTVRNAAPSAEERISYGMPAYFLGDVLVYFAAHKKHIGLYPPVRDKSLSPLVARYAGPKGNLQFPLAEPMPHGLIAKIVEARVKARGKVKTTKVGPRKPHGTTSGFSG